MTGILISGTIAIDIIMRTDQAFRDVIGASSSGSMNVAVSVAARDRRWGGAGANIAYNLAILGETPILVATVGDDFGEYAEWLDRNGISREYVYPVVGESTAVCFITTDSEQEQFTVFHPGAMARAYEIPVAVVSRACAAAIVAPNAPRAMLEHAAELKRTDLPIVVDPGQMVPEFSRVDLRRLIDGATLLIANESEMDLVHARTGWPSAAVLERVGVVITTKGAGGSDLVQGARTDLVELERPSVRVPAVPPVALIDPTGCGDAYRAGVLQALARRLPLVFGARVGALLASLNVAEQGAQAIRVGRSEIRRRIEEMFPEAVLAERGRSETTVSG